MCSDIGTASPLSAANFPVADHARAGVLEEDITGASAIKLADTHHRRATARERTGTETRRVLTVGNVPHIGLTRGGIEPENIIVSVARNRGRVARLKVYRRDAGHTRAIERIDAINVRFRK